MKNTITDVITDELIVMRKIGVELTPFVVYVIIILVVPSVEITDTIDAIAI